jgi:hypothetical protein
MRKAKARPATGDRKLTDLVPPSDLDDSSLTEDIGLECFENDYMADDIGDSYRGLSSGGDWD